MEEKDVYQLLYIAALIHRQRTEALTDEEQEVLDKWLAASEANRQLFGELSHEQLTTDTLEELEATSVQGSYERILSAAGLRQRHPRPRIFLRRWAWAAAALLLMVTGTYLFMNKRIAPPPIVVTPPLQDDVVPGGRKATLTLAGGNVISLDDAKNGVVAGQGKTLIRKTANGQLVYDASQAGADAASGPPSYNTVATPRGGEYQVVLPDGSRVWLNAASSIRFPTVFTGASRKVEITGEAYFEVTGNARMPFHVIAGAQTIDVLGTDFNVQSYQEENAIKTTLIKGSVRISLGSQSNLLRPGQQASAATATGISVTADADLEEALAWKNGFFVFNDTGLGDVIHQLERWYGVDMDGTDINISTYRFNGRISRNVTLSNVLKMMEVTSNLHFSIKGRTIHIKE